MNRQRSEFGRILAFLMASMVALSFMPAAAFAETEEAVNMKSDEFGALEIVRDQESAFASEITSENSARISEDNNTIYASSEPETYTYTVPETSTYESYFKVVVPDKGYLLMYLSDNGPNDYSAQIMTEGFGDYEYPPSDGTAHAIGVKKGTYIFAVKTYASELTIGVRFTKVKESKFGKNKKKAAKLKKKKTSKGVIVTDQKKVHWYKIKNTKTQKVKVIVNHMVTGGGDYGGIKVSFYDKRGLMGSQILHPTDGRYTAQLYTFGMNNKLVKGTYWVKVQSYSKGSGYFTVKWK